jgi:hypothetical protein
MSSYRIEPSEGGFRVVEARADGEETVIAGFVNDEAARIWLANFVLPSEWWVLAPVNSHGFCWHA